jgi:methyltransferase (TIGR00027 family)
MRRTVWNMGGKNHGTSIRISPSGGLCPAQESQLPEEERICQDPVAEHLLSEEGRYFLTTEQGREHFNNNVSSPMWVGTRDYVALRTRVIDSLVTDCASRGIEQLVILGAGYDSRAHRLPELHHKVKIFEVDRRETQEDKKAKLAKHFGALPDYVTFVPVDFETDDLAVSLARAGFDPNARTLVIWEGVLQFLDPEAVAQTLGMISSSTPSGSTLIFDYVVPEAVDGTSQNPVMQALKQIAAEIGEPFKFGMDRQEMAGFLKRHGFELKKNLTVEQCKEMFLTPAQRQRSPLEEYAIVQAVVV